MSNPESRAATDSPAILYFETDQNACTTLQNHERWQDIAVKTVEDATVALDMIESDQYDALIVEPTSLTRDGKTFLTAIKEIIPDLPVILYTVLPEQRNQLN